MSSVMAPAGDSSLTESRVRPVRVSYFDPRTGKPCDSKPEPLGEHDQQPGWSVLAAEPKPGGRRGRGIVVKPKAGKPGKGRAEERRDGRLCVCRVCGAEFRASARGRKPSVCRECRAESVAATPAPGSSRYKPKVNKLGGRSNAVPVYVDGKLFMSIREAAASVDGNISSLATVLRKGGTRYKGHDVRRAL